MARVRGGVSPHHPLGCSPSSPAGSLTLPQECYWTVKRKLAEAYPSMRFYDHLPGLDGTRKLRIYPREYGFVSALRILHHDWIPFDLVYPTGEKTSRRCRPDGRYELITNEMVDELDMSWENQWKIRSVLKTLRLINPPNPE